MRHLLPLVLLGAVSAAHAAWPGPESRAPHAVPPDLVSPFGRERAPEAVQSGPAQAWQVAEAVRSRRLQGVVLGPSRRVAILGGRVVRSGDRVASEAAGAEPAPDLELRLGAVDGTGVVVEARTPGAADVVEARVALPPRASP